MILFIFLKLEEWVLLPIGLLILFFIFAYRE